MAQEAEYESISKNDYRNLPEYRRFIQKKEVPESTEFGKNYHLFRAKPAEQMSLENTVYGRKMRVAGIEFGAGLLSLLLYGAITALLAKAGVVLSEAAECWLSVIEVIGYVLEIIAALQFVGTMNGPITIKDVERYRGAIEAAWEKEQEQDAKRPKHPPRKGESKPRRR